MWNDDWKKGEDYPAWGNNDVYKKTISGDIYLTEKHLKKHTRESLKQSLVDCINQKWLKRFLNISGMVGCVLLVLYSPTRGLTAAFLLAVLVLTLLIRYRILDKRI